jgi:hypothetical protein
MLAFGYRPVRKPSPAIVPNFIDQYLEEPGPAVGSGFESVKCLPCVQVGLLHQIVGFGSIPDQMNSCPIEIIEIRQGHGLKFRTLHFFPKEHALPPHQSTVPVRLGPGRCHSVRKKPWPVAFIPETANFFVAANL